MVDFGGAKSLKSEMPRPSVSRSMTRVGRLFNRKGQPGRIPVGHSYFYQAIVHHSDDDLFIGDTDVPRLKLIRLGPNAVFAFDDEVDAVIEGLRHWRDKSLAGRTS